MRQPKALKLKLEAVVRPQISEPKRTIFLLLSFIFVASTVPFECRAFPSSPAFSRLPFASIMGRQLAASSAADTGRTSHSDDTFVSGTAGSQARQDTPNSRTLLSPSAVSERLFGSNSSDQRPIILFDGVCNLCNGAVNLALDWDPKGKLRFAALQSHVGKALLQRHGRDANDISSIVLVTKQGAFVKSDAILRITQALSPLPFLPLQPAARLSIWLVPRFLRDLIYDGVADNRYDLLGKSDSCRFDADGEFEDRFVGDELAFETSTREDTTRSQRRNRVVD